MLNQLCIPEINPTYVHPSITLLKMKSISGVPAVVQQHQQQSLKHQDMGSITGQVQWIKHPALLKLQCRSNLSPGLGTPFALE